MCVLAVDTKQIRLYAKKSSICEVELFGAKTSLIMGFNMATFGILWQLYEISPLNVTPIPYKGFANG